MINYTAFPIGHPLVLKNESLMVKLCRADGTVLMQQLLQPETGLMIGFTFTPELVQLKEEDETFINFAKACGAKEEDIDVVGKKFKVSVKVADDKKLSPGWVTGTGDE